MTKKELIEKLSQYPDNAEVVMHINSRDWEYQLNGILKRVATFNYGKEPIILLLGEENED